MMETLSLVLAATAGVYVLLIIATNLYFKFRPNFAKRVTCWFCHMGTKVPYDKRTCWTCPSCEQYNGFSADGGYNKPIPAQYMESLNSQVSVKKSNKEQKVLADNGLCAHCNMNQQLKVQQLASFSPLHPDRFNEEVEEFRKKLEHYYQLCNSCDTVLKNTLKKQSSWILGLQLNLLRKKTLRQKDNIMKQLSRLRVSTALCLRYASAVLASWILISMAAHLVDPSLRRIPLSPAIHALLCLQFPDLPNHIILPEVLRHLFERTLSLEVFLTALGLVIQSGVGFFERKVPHRSSWKRVDVLCCGLWAVCHCLSWVVLGGSSYWTSKGIFKAVHGSIVFSVLLSCLTSTLKSVQRSGQLGKISLKKKLLSDGLDFSDNEEVETAFPSQSDRPTATDKQPSAFSKYVSRPTAMDKQPSTFSEFITAPAANISKPSSRFSFNSISKNTNCGNNTDIASQAVLNSANSAKCHRNCDTTSQLGSEFYNNDCINDFKNLGKQCKSGCNSNKDTRSAYKTKSRCVKSTLSPSRKSPSDISDLLNSSVGNIQLPVGTPAKDVYDTCSSQNQLPLEIDNGLSNLKLGTPVKDTGPCHRPGSDDGYMELFKGCNSTSACHRRSVLGPSRFQPRTNVARSSWVAGGFWQAPGLADTSPACTDVNTPLSRSSSQSSGFVSQSSQLPNSRSSSICGADCDVQSMTSDRYGSGFFHSSPTQDGKSHTFNRLESRPSVVYKMSGGVNYPTSVSSDESLDSSFSTNKNLVYSEHEHPSYVFQGDRTIRYPSPLFSPQPFYFQQSFPPQYLPTYGARVCYPQQFAMPPLWNPSAFAFPQQQLCISPALGDTSRSSSRCSEGKDSLEVKTPAASFFSRLKFSMTNILIIVALACSLFYNAVYSGLLSLPNPG